VVERVRKLDLVALVWSTVLSSGSDDSGRLIDVKTRYEDEADVEVVRGSFYAWFDEALAMLMTALTNEALKKVWALPPYLKKALVGVDDWIAMDSETVTLRPALADAFPATSTPAGLKIHKLYSLGRGSMVGFEITPAREHDAPRLKIDESWRGLGLIVDLGYASFQLIRDCQRYGVELIIRLKSGWKPRLLRSVVDGELIEVLGEPELVGLLDAEADELTGAEADVDVVFGRGKDRVEVRLVGVPGDEHYHWCLTTLPRATHAPSLICELYRTRWEIELDNRRDKGAARLDQIRATTVSSVMTLIHASLLRTILANMVVYHDLQDRPPTRPPLHSFAVALAMCGLGHRLQEALRDDCPHRWEKLARGIRSRGHDPNWRSRPSPLDRLRGTTAPPGRPKRSRLRDCGPEARPYRRAA